jgi:hypothetical protein
MVVFHVSTFILLLHPAGGFSYVKTRDLKCRNRPISYETRRFFMAIAIAKPAFQLTLLP